MIYEVFNQNSKYYRQMMDIIVAAKVNPPEKGQVHHIIPRCWFKHFHQEVDNSISNTVLLTWQDHKLVHSLAYKCAKEKWFKSKLAYACHMFGDMDPKYNHSEETRRKIGESLLGKNKGKKLSSEHKQKLKDNHVGMLNKHHTDETKQKISKSRTGIKFSLEHKQKLSLCYKGRHWKIIDGKRIWI